MSLCHRMRQTWTNSQQQLLLRPRRVAGGVTLYVAASDLVPEVEQTQGRRGLLLMLTGIILFWITDRLLAVAGPH